MTTYEQIQEQVANLVEAPNNLVGYFNAFDNEDDKTIAYYCLAIKFPEQLVEILEAYHGRQLILEELIVSAPKAKIAKEPKAKTTSGSKSAKLVEIINVVTGEKAEVSGGMLLKEGNPTGVVFSKAEKDRIIYYNKTIHSWKRVEEYIKP